VVPSQKLIWLKKKKEAFNVKILYTII
jgi:hypothetical protein